MRKIEYQHPKDKTIPDLFWEQVQVQPNCIAVVYADKSLTYNELNENSLELASYLHYLGVNPDEGIGLFIESSIELMIGVWGILFSGGAYLPLSPEYPEERLSYMITDSKIRIIITQDALKARLLKLVPESVQVITLNDAKEFKASKRKANQFESKTNLKPHHLAYIIYTSGSTGKPKGVMIEHRSIVNQMEWLKNTFKLNDQSVILQKTPMSFDAAQWEILAPSCGSKVVMGNPGIYKNPEQLITVLLKHSVTMLQCVPTLLQALLDTNELQHCKTLTQIFSGGEALSKHLALECINTLPHCNLINLYGPTECTINSSAFVIDRNTLEAGSSTISIGKPISNIQYYILENGQLPVADGKLGELYIGGIGLARGYLHKPHLTAEKFVDNPFDPEDKKTKLYKTGDLAYWNSDGTVQYAGRTDSQIKLRGFRIELDEIKAAIETHDWIKNSAVIVKDDPYTGYQNLIAFIELNPKEAALMDQGNHDTHHQSKESKAQVMMQLSNKGCREKITLEGKEVIDLASKTATEKQIHTVFSRKTYRFFEGGNIKKDDILRLLTDKVSRNPLSKIEDLSYTSLGEILRYFGQYISKERLLPKYGYASPGALYATRMYLELDSIGGLKSGYYYYHPVHHQLILIKNKKSFSATRIKIHFIGKKSAIEPIYKNNIREVLEIETGHMVGLFEEILPEYGLSIEDAKYRASIKNILEVVPEDFYLGSFQIVSGKKKQLVNPVDIYVQSHPEKIADLKTGLYQYKGNNLEKISNEIILRKQVIAINQEVYNRSSFGISIVSKTDKDWMAYINLGRKLQSLQMNNTSIGFMSAGYSSKTGNDLPSAKRLQAILGQSAKPSYFFIGGLVSNEQINSQGMKEDTVHMKGPAEMIKEDLANFLPHYMVPNKVIVLDKIPLTVNGKIDTHALNQKDVELVQREYIPARTEIEKEICNIWKKETKRESISVNDNFFELGGNSLIAVSLVNKLNKSFGSSLPLQILFESPTVEKLAARISHEQIRAISRLVPLQTKGSKNPIYCWPGLGGYCMNLRLLATKMGKNQPFYGVQAYGINENETPYSTIKEMAAEDIKMIKKLQPVGPYTLWGYSFGARVAFEAAHQLEQSGERVENLFLIAPGSPEIQESFALNNNRQANYSNKTYTTILFSVFMGSITDSALKECLETAKDDESFINCITKKNSKLEPELVRKIINIVAKTYEFKYSFNELTERRLNTPITIFKASGDDYSFIENSNGFSSIEPTIWKLKADHYSLLKESGIDELVETIKLKPAGILDQKKLTHLSEIAIHKNSERIPQQAISSIYFNKADSNKTDKAA